MQQAKKKITVAQTQEAIDSNETGITYFSNKLRRKLEKNKKRIIKRDAVVANRNQNARKAMEAKKQQAEKLDIPKADVKMAPVFADKTDEELISAVIVMGANINDLTDGGVDILRAIRIEKEARVQIVKRNEKYAIARMGAESRAIGASADNNTQVRTVDLTQQNPVISTTSA